MEDNFEEWDMIMKEREKIAQENPNLENVVKKCKTFICKDGEKKCTKCGSGNDIGGCHDCTTK